MKTLMVLLLVAFAAGVNAQTSNDYYNHPDQNEGSVITTDANAMPDACEKKFTAYFDSASRQLFLHGGKNNEKDHIFVINMAGQVLIAEQRYPEDNRVDCRNLPDGMFIIKKFNAYEEEQWTFSTL
jgi:hypothetical protein